MKFYIITDNTYLFAGIKHLLSDRRSTLHRVSSSDICALIYPTNVILLMDGAHHEISTQEYQHLNKRNIPVFFILNINNDILSQLSGINILNACDTADSLRKSLVNLSRDELPSYDQQVYLTHTESVILRLYISGLSSLQISQKITVDKKTVYSHIRNILHKTGIKKIRHLTLLKSILYFHLSHSR